MRRGLLIGPRGADITQSYLWTSNTATPNAIYLCFPGHTGVLNLRKDKAGAIKFEHDGQTRARYRGRHRRLKTPISPGAHGYLGRETQVVEAIRAWLAGKPYPNLIE